MERSSPKAPLGEELQPRRGVILGAIALAVLATGAVFAVVVFRQATRPRNRPVANLLETVLSGPGKASPRDVPPRPPTPLDDFNPLPDGGWPPEPRSPELMDEVPSGVLLQGTVDDEGEEDETPGEEIQISGFFIDRYEVTNAQYQECVDDGVCHSPLDLDRSRFGNPRQPVVGVNWFDATTFCRWAGKRLPTEAEWERAARGDERRLYPWGDALPRCEWAVFTLCDRYGPAEVGGRPNGAGPFGTQDLAGNVWEWVQDWYAPRYYPSKPEGDPEGPPAGRQRVLRGGSWHFGAAYIRTANRHRDDPTERTPWYGFRCAYRPPPPPPPPAPTTPLDGGATATRKEGRIPLSITDLERLRRRTSFPDW